MTLCLFDAKAWPKLLLTDHWDWSLRKSTEFLLKQDIVAQEIASGIDTNMTAVILDWEEMI